MKRLILVFLSMLVISATFLTGCGNSEKKEANPTEAAKEQYQCPMKCTEEIFDKPGNCAVCGMELEKVSKS